MTTILRWIRNLLGLITGLLILALGAGTLCAIFGWETEFPHWFSWETVPVKGGGTTSEIVNGDYWGFLWQSLVCIAVATIIGGTINVIYYRMMIRKAYRQAGGDIDAMLDLLDEENEQGRFDY